MSVQSPKGVQPASGTLGVLCVGLGAVATTFVAGVENVRRGRSAPIGALSQMGTIRLGKRTEGRTPLIKDFVPLASLEQLAFGAWDPIPDNAYEAALKAGVLDRHEHLDPIKDFLAGVVPALLSRSPDGKRPHQPAEHDDRERDAHQRSTTPPSRAPGRGRWRRRR